MCLISKVKQLNMTVCIRPRGLEMYSALGMQGICISHVLIEPDSATHTQMKKPLSQNRDRIHSQFQQYFHIRIEADYCFVYVCSVI